ncbi:uncharacterized lipoprotein YehR (DUF1307 family) [Pullulanibacillus pueri]|uniref:Lipoprotein n=1 Tax=Pullulanibacillus pueri TaxID=1437324 RepID=A0A8J2ZU81_9BACL|nr:hypothetical protein [Pullulanibacillus pueri]MBM7681472.1 uncharacterized lipoprotein YehR (DUF1307 family) [Pullulanibacillus pueri]GGH79016.1 hypothetical protein GCM10007096_13320 [Pullulanibacillus pueri]
MKRFFIYIILTIFLLSLSGCMNSESDTTFQHQAYKAQLVAVQDAIDSYHKDTGVLPIKNSTEDTPIYQKYRIDFKKLKEYLPNPPSDAYEQGGDFEYVLINPEKDPTVKVIDMSLVSKVQDLNRDIQVYYSNHKFSPLKDILADGRYSIDYKALGYKKPLTVTSPYSGRQLGFILNEKGEACINYLPDIYDAVKKSNKTYKEGYDLRQLLTNSTPYVPIDSVAYTMKKGEVVFLLNK